MDTTVTAKELGKPVGNDAAHEKSTYVSLLGLDKARTLAAERTEAAVASLSIFGEAADDLRRLAQALLVRTH